MNISQNNIQKSSAITIKNNTMSSESTTVQTNPLENTPEQNGSSFTSDQFNSQSISEYNSAWNNVAIAIAVGTAGVVGGIVFVVKKTRKNTQ